MLIKNILLIGTLFLILIMIIQVSQFLMLRVFFWNQNVTENVMTPLALLLSFVVGYFLANRPEE